MSSTILRVNEAARRCGLSRSMLFALKARGDFPQAVRLTGRTVGFVEAEIEAWIQQRVEASRSGPKSAYGTDAGLTLNADDTVAESETDDGFNQ